MDATTWKKYKAKFDVSSKGPSTLLTSQRDFAQNVEWVVLPSGGGGEKKLFLIIVNVLGHPKGVGGLTSNFLRGGGMDVFWNYPISLCIFQVAASLPTK
jgi:hypothetical protein